MSVIIMQTSTLDIKQDDRSNNEAYQVPLWCNCKEMKQTEKTNRVNVNKLLLLPSLSNQLSYKMFCLQGQCDEVGSSRQNFALER